MEPRWDHLGANTPASGRFHPIGESHGSAFGPQRNASPTLRLEKKSHRTQEPVSCQQFPDRLFRQEVAGFGILQHHEVADSRHQDHLVAVALSSFGVRSRSIRGSPIISPFTKKEAG